MSARGTLVVVGTGIRCPSQITFEARAAIEGADEVLTIAIDPLMMRWLERLNPRVESLHELYATGKDRRLTYDEMTDRVLDRVRSGARVCFALYGHPGVLVYPSREAIRRARLEGFEATMLPGVSAEDCLFADLSFDLATCGCASYEVNDFLIYRRPFDASSALIVWQIALAGESTQPKTVPNVPGLRVLADHLARVYGPDHSATLYEAAQYPLVSPRIDPVTIAALPEAVVTTRTTLFVPPKTRAEPDAEMLRRLGYSA